MRHRTQSQKPYPKFPLTHHRNGQWCKKINGRVRYFGTDSQEALKRFLEERDDLYAGREPRRNGEPILADAMDQFLSAKKLMLDTGELTQASYTDYQQTCDKVGDSLGLTRMLSDIRTPDLERLRADLAKGKRRTPDGKQTQVNPVTHKGELTRARVLFNYVSDSITPISYRKPLRSPSRTLLRKAKSEAGERMFEAEQIRSMIDAAPQPLCAMIWLGINCGFGPSDCARLPLDKLDLERAWHSFGRPKTHNERKCPLWQETVASLRDAIALRSKPQRGCEGLVFLTANGGSFALPNAQTRISKQFQRLLKDLSIYRKGTGFNALRNTVETIGGTAGEQVAVDHIMGHIAPSDDMAAVYRQRQFATPLLKVVNHVRDWLLNDLNIE